MATNGITRPARVRKAVPAKTAVPTPEAAVVTSTAVASEAAAVPESMPVAPVAEVTVGGRTTLTLESIGASKTWERFKMPSGYLGTVYVPLDVVEVRILLVHRSE